MKVELPDPKHPDMSPEAIDERLRMVEALRRLGISLKEAGERGPIQVENQPVQGVTPGVDNHPKADR